MRQDLANQLHILKQAQQTEKILFEDISVNVELAHYNLQKGAVKAGKSLEPTSEQISISVRQFEGCHVSCSCICHKKSRLSTPSFLNNIFGSLFVEYTGTPLGKLKCSLGSCRSRTAVPSTHFTYYFPQWFLSAAVDVTILRGTFGEPSAALAVKNVRDRDHDLFKAVYRGDLPHLRDLFTHGNARPSDIDEFGHTLLTVRTSSKKSNMKEEDH
jgi:hypothetical protein